MSKSFTEAELVDLRNQMRTAMLGVGDVLRAGHGNAPQSNKKSTSAADTVTEIDIEVDRLLSEQLLSDSIGYHGEERGKAGNPDVFWLVDPIDGTGHYLRGNPMSTSMASLIDHGEVVIAGINDFVAGDFYSAITGQGAFRNDTPIHVSDRGLQDAYMAFEIDLHDDDSVKIFTDIYNECIVVFAINCGWDFTRIASGGLDGRLMYKPFGKAWDFAPGGLLVREAGGKVVNLGSETFDYLNFDFFAGSPRLYGELLAKGLLPTSA